MTTLPPVLGTDDLPLAELFAARLDGELFRIDDAFSPIDEIEGQRHRARALRLDLPARLIAEQRSAAWIWGALAAPPTRHELCVARGARVTAGGVGRMSVREVVIEPQECISIDGMQLTTRLRTVVDLARFSVLFGEAEESMVARLMLDGAFGLRECLADLNRRTNLPNKRRAAQRLRAAIGASDYPLLTRYTS